MDKLKRMITMWLMLVYSEPHYDMYYLTFIVTTNDMYNDTQCHR